ncbi:MAG: hypothetical protein ABIA04_09455 [Pseudomonadota bacterium]
MNSKGEVSFHRKTVVKNKVFPDAIKDYIATNDYQISFMDLNKNDIFACFGFGLGDMIKSVCEKVKKVYAFDLDHSNVGKIKKQLTEFSNIYFRQESMRGIDLNSINFSKAIISGALSELSDYQKRIFINKLSRAMPMGGLLLIEDKMLDYDKTSIEDDFFRILDEAKRYYGSNWNNEADDFVMTLKFKYISERDYFQRILNEASFDVLISESDSSFFGRILAKKSV